MNLDYGKLIKMLRLTESSNDGEALAAIRAANRELKRAGMEWMNIIIIRPEAYAAQQADVFAQAAADVRARRGAQWREDVRTRQAERDAEFTNRYTSDFNTGWTEKGPGDDWPTARVYRESQPSDEEVAIAQLAVISDEEAKTNWYCFAMSEPELAKLLFDQRDESYLARVLFKRVCLNGELNEHQLAVLRLRLKNEPLKAP